MTDNFNFDDLPDWLKNSGADDESSAPEEDLSVEWESQKPTDPSGGGRLGVTGELPWLQGNADPNTGARRSSELEGFDWDSLPNEDVAPPSAPPPQATGATGELPGWILGATDDDDNLDADMGEDFADLFTSAVDETDDLETPSELGLKRVSSEPKIRKLGDTGEIRDPSEMTFEEWERFQEEKEYRQENAAQIQIEQDIPDWFRDNVDLGDAERGLDAILLDDFEDVEAASSSSKPATDDLSTSANYVPEWFLGLDEQNLDEAADWVRGATSTTDISSLTDSSMFALPPELADVEAEPAPADPASLFGMDDDEAGAFELATSEREAADDWLDSVAQAQDDSLSELDNLMADAAVLAAQAPNTAALLSDVLQQDNLQPEMDWLTTSSDDNNQMGWLATSSDDEIGLMLETSADDFEDWMERGEEGEPLDTDDYFAMVQPSDSAPGWMSEPADAPDEAVDDDDLFAALLGEGDEFSSESVDWLGDVDDLDFDEAAVFDEPAAPPTSQRPPAPPESMREALKNTGSIDQILTDLLSSTASPKSVAVDNQSRALMRTSGESDGIDDLFEDVDDDFLAALNATEAFPAASPIEPEAPREELPPGWIEDLRPDRQVRLAAGGIELEFEQLPPNALPEGVQALREASQAVSNIAPNEAALDSGALAGVSGGLPVFALDRPEEETVLQSGIAISPQQSERIGLLSDVLELGQDEDEGAEEAATARPRRKIRRRAQLKLDRAVVAVVLLGALAGPFVTDGLHLAEEPALDEFAVQQAAVFAAVDGLQPGDRVLLAFEYGPTAAGELNPLAEAVLRDLFNQGAVPVTLSTNPLGGPNSFYVVNSLATDRDFLGVLERDAALTDGQNFYSIGFVSGGPVAIRSMVRSETFGALTFDASISDDDAPLEIGRVEADDFAMVIVIAENTEDLRNWAEQFDVDGLPKYALVTTAIEPIASAYLNDNGGYKGYLAGYRDTYRYNQVRNIALRTPINNTTDFPDPELAQWHSMALGALASGGVIMLGVLLNLIRGIGKRRR